MQIKEQPKQKNTRRGPGILPIMAVSLTIFGLILIIWMSVPAAMERLRGPATPTAPLPTATRRPTRTPTITPTPTIVPTATRTPMAPSVYTITDFTTYYPSIPDAAVLRSAVVVPADKVVSDPPFSHPQWDSAEKTAQNLSVEITQNYYATLGKGSATWLMDVPLEAGYYQVYILDTLYSSAGPLDFNVMLGGNALQPVFGNRHIVFQSSKYSEPPQVEDKWRSIGTYAIDSSGLLSVSTGWDKRDEYSTVAIGPMLVAQLPDSARAQIDPLPKGVELYFVDDTSATVTSEDTIFSSNTEPSWGDNYQFFVNPAKDIKVTWEMPERAEVGQYQIYFWVPGVHSKGKVVFKVLVNDVELPGGLIMEQGYYQTAQWIALGAFPVSNVENKSMRLALRMEVAGGTPGDIALDVVAFARVP